MDYGSEYEKKHQLHGKGRRKRRENPKTWIVGNHAGQVAVVSEEDVSVPVVTQPHSSRSESIESTPPRSPSRRSVRRLREGLGTRRRNDVYAFPDSDESK